MITIHDRELCSKFFDCGDQLVQRASERPKSNSSKPVSARPVATRSTSTCSGVQRSHSAAAMYRTKEWLSMKSRRNIMMLPSDNEMECVRERCRTISDEEAELMQELETLLTAESSQAQCKREMLYKKWSERVFDPLFTALKVTMETHGTVMDSQRRHIFNEFLDTVNNKDVFLNIINTSEYNPLMLQTQAVPAKTTTLNDPLTAQHEDYALELQVIRGCDVGVANSKGAGPHYGRQDTDPVVWLAMQLVQIDSEARQRTRRNLKGSRNISHLDRTGTPDKIMTPPVTIDDGVTDNN